MNPQSDSGDIWHAGPPPLPPSGARSLPPPAKATRRRPAPRPKRRWLTALGYAALTVACLCVGAVAFVLIAAPVDLIRDRVIEQVKARTGQTLAVAGPISLSLFPRPAVSLGEVSLSGPDGAQTATVLAAPRIDAELNLWSVLTPHAAVERVVLYRPTIDLGPDAAGRPLWTSTAAPSARAPAADAAPGRQQEPAETQPDAAGRAQLRLSNLGLTSLRIVDGTVRYRDRTGGIAEARAVNLVLSAGDASGAARIDGTATVRDAAIAFSAQVDSLGALLARQTSRLLFKASGPPFSASYDGTLSLARGASLAGAIRVEAPSLDGLARWAGRPIPDAGAERVALAAKLQASSERATLTDLQASMGQATVTGSLEIDLGGARSSLSGNLDFADLDVGRMLVASRHGAAPASRSADAELRAATKAPAAASRPAALPPPAQVRERGWSEQPYNLAVLSAFDANLAITAQRITYKEIKTGAGRLHLAANAGTGKVTIESVELYGGRGQGFVTFDATGDLLVSAANLHLDGVSLQPLLADAVDFQWLEGRGRVAVMVAGQGLTERQMVEGLNGKMDIAGANGALVGIDVGKAVRSLQSARLPSLSFSPSEKTAFDQIAGTFAITNGVARNSDLKLTGPHLQLNGEGSIDLGQRLVDYTVRTKVGGTPDADATLKVGSIEVPVTISGPWHKPSFGIKGQEHLTGALKQIRRNLRSQEVKDAIKGLLEGNGEKRIKPRDLIDKLLKKE